MATRGIKAITCLQGAKLLLSRSSIRVSRASKPISRLHTSARTRQAQPVTIDKQSASLHQTLVPDHIYDVVIVGGGVAGTALACSLGMCYVYGPAGDFYEHALIFVLQQASQSSVPKRLRLLKLSIWHP